MAGSKDPPKSKGKGGRPKGATDKTRDYPAAVARMRALQAGGASDREVTRVVGRELNIPASTLRTYLRRERKTSRGWIDLTSAIGVSRLSPEEAEEIRKRGDEIRRELEAKEEKRRAREEARRERQQFLDLLRNADRHALHIPRPKKPRR